jgi:hypothetical protein
MAAMAENQQAATATASAATAPSASGSGPAMSTTGNSATFNSELMASPSFDVESFLAGEEKPAGETNLEDAESAEDTTAGTETAEDESPTGDESASTEETAPEGEAATSEDDDAQPEGLKPKAIKRFNKLLEQRNAAQAEAAQVKAQLAEIKAQQEAKQDAPTPVKVDSDPLASVTSEEQLEAHESFNSRVKAWCRRNPGGGVPPKELTGGTEIELTAEQVVDNLEQAEAMLESIPKRRAFLDEFRAKRAEARAAYPNVFKAGTPEHDTAKTLLPRLLNFRTQADQDALLAKLVKVELMEREERDGVARYTRVPLKNQTPASAASGKPMPKPVTQASPVPPVRQTNGQSSKTLAWEKSLVPGASVDVEDLLGD